MAEQTFPVRWRLPAILIAIVGLLLFCARREKADDIVYEGKTLNHWLDGGFEDASRALYDVGPPAAKCVFAKLKREHPKYSRSAQYRSFWLKMPQSLRGVLPKPKPVSFDEWRACHALLAIGPGVIPSLGESLDNPDRLVRAVSAETLADFHQRGVRIDSALPALERALQDPDASVRKFAAQAKANPGQGVRLIQPELHNAH
jgi:hypothetical protein